MKRASSLKIFAKHVFMSLIEHLENYQIKKDNEILHQIRVDIKKIKSLLSFLDNRCKGFKAHKRYLPLRTIFRRAGEIREPEIMSKLLLAYNIPGIHDHRINSDSEKLVGNFCDEIPAFIDVVNTQWLKLKPVLKPLGNKDLDKFLKKLKKDIKKKLIPNPDMQLIHKVRKSIKTFIYLSQAGRHRHKKLIDFFSKEVDAIGLLHDRLILLGIMAKQNGTADKMLIDKIRHECSQLQRRITRKALRYYNP